MHKYFIKIPWVVKKIFPDYIWHLPSADTVYLTFDDGPHPTITPWVLDQLKEHNAQATFFCIGSNVEKYPEVYQRILNEGHAVGNHTYRHLNGWKTDDKTYLEDILEAAALLNANLFRPPYGRIKNKQAKQLFRIMPNVKIIMWDILGCDFDVSITPQQCLANVVENVSAGSIIVFHDSEKAFNNLRFALPKTLEFLKNGNCQLKKIGW